MELGVRYPQITARSTSRKLMVCGETSKGGIMNSVPSWVPYVVLGAFAWVLLPFLIPLFCFYCVVKVSSAWIMGKAVEEVHNED